MRKLLFFSALGAALLTSCNKDAATIQESGLNAGLPTKPHATIPVDANGIIKKTLLSKDTVWKIDGVSFVKPGTTLTIQAGTFIVAGVTKPYPDQITGVTQNIKGVLVVPKTAKLNAIGTAAEPIVFTSDKASGQRNPGDFGGVVILGNSTTNQPLNTRIEGIPQPVGVDVTYGGSNPADNSGALKYVRIEFAGFNLAQDNEINGLTLGGVGSGTQLENIQVSWGKDDAFEFFGGTVNAKYLVALSTDDDDFDFDHGYRGTIQYALSLKDPNATYSGFPSKPTDSNGLESDNSKDGNPFTDATKLTRPVLKNFTFIGQSNTTAGTRLLYGNRWRRKSSLDITNSIIAGYNTGASFEDISAGVFSNNVVHAYTAAFNGTAPGTGNQTSVGNTSTAAGDYLKLSGGQSIFYVTGTAQINPANLRPLANSPAYGDGSTTYKGAFHPTQAPWTVGWTQFAPKTY
ncbi:MULTISPECIES: hypothetical protein [Sphingobacterium]|uniref:hypothetical protein n=1 Tax=Sphingobacterium TaxID=28453 RepID=UPI000B94418D|nr:hypothetical protein CHT99_18205 [Sphingobacterium cellulitidis]